MQADWKQRASEGITVFRASRLEALLEPLDHLLRTQAPASPLAPQTVVAAHPGMRQWLAGALARRRGPGGIVANLDIVLPSTFLDGLAPAVLGEAAVATRTESPSRGVAQANPTHAASVAKVAAMPHPPSAPRAPRRVGRRWWSRGVDG